MAVDERAEVSFSIPQMTVAVTTNFVGKIDRKSTQLTRVCVGGRRRTSWPNNNSIP